MSRTFFSHLASLALAFTPSSLCGPSISLPELVSPIDSPDSGRPDLSHPCNLDSPRSCVEQHWDPLWAEFGRDAHCSTADFKDLAKTTGKAQQQKGLPTPTKKGARKRITRTQRAQKIRPKKRRRSCTKKEERVKQPKRRVNKRFNCPYCSSKSNDVYYLARHFIQRHEQEACPYTCHYPTTSEYRPCKSKLVDSSYARAHLRAHLGSGIFPVPDDQFKTWIKRNRTKETVVADRLKEIRTWLIAVNKATVRQN